MKFRKNSIITFVLILSLVFNGIQYLQVKDLPQVKQEYVDELFRSKLKTVIDGIGFLDVETVENSVRNLSYNFNSMAEFYVMTSYYLHNPQLKESLWHMKNVLTMQPYTPVDANGTPISPNPNPNANKKVEDVITKEDIRAFQPVVQKLFMNAKDKEAGDEFEALVSDLGNRVKIELGYPEVDK